MQEPDCTNGLVYMYFSTDFGYCCVGQSSTATIIAKSMFPEPCSNPITLLTFSIILAYPCHLQAWPVQWATFTCQIVNILFKISHNLIAYLV